MLNFDTMKDTLRTLAKTASAEAGKLTAAKDKTQKMQLENKKKRLDDLRANVVALEEFIVSGIAGPDTKNAAQTAAQFLYNVLAPYQGYLQQHPNLVAALNDDQFNGNAALFHQMTEAFKRNHELKKIMDDHMKRLLVNNKQAYDKALIDINALLEEENNIMKSLGNNIPTQTLVDMNRKWAELLKRVFNVQGLSELKETTATTSKSKNPFSQWGQNFFAAVSGLFKTLNDPTQDSKGAQMNFIGTMIQMVVGLFANLFGRFLGKDAAPQVAELTQNVSTYFTNVLSEAYKKEEETKEKTANKAKSKKKSNPSMTPSFSQKRKEAETQSFTDSEEEDYMADYEDEKGSDLEQDKKSKQSSWFSGFPTFFG